MKKRTFIFDTSGGAGEALAKVLLHYVEAAYPKGGSDCATASREALLSVITKIRSNELCEINTRQRPVLTAAVKWFYQESGYPSKNDVSLAEFEHLQFSLNKKRLNK